MRRGAMLGVARTMNFDLVEETKPAEDDVAETH